MELSKRIRNLELPHRSGIATYEITEEELTEVTQLEAELAMYERDETFGTLAIQLTQLETRIASARAIMQKFVNKVDTGMARNKETYAEMKAWLEE